MHVLERLDQDAATAVSIRTLKSSHVGEESPSESFLFTEDEKYSGSYTAVGLSEMAPSLACFDTLSRHHTSNLYTLSRT